MNDSLQQAFNRLPQVLEKNGPEMMRRMVARMKAKLASGERPGDVSHGLLFLKVGEADLVREFAAAIGSTFVRNELSDFAGLSLEPEGGRLDDSEFASSDAAFDRLEATLAGLRVHGVERYARSKFLDALRDAFIRSRMDERATRELAHCARLELNTELQSLYTNVESWMTKAAQGRA
jgi:hypothetical protein